MLKMQSYVLLFIGLPKTGLAYPQGWVPNFTKTNQIEKHPNRKNCCIILFKFTHPSSPLKKSANPLKNKLNDLPLIIPITLKKTAISITHNCSCLKFRHWKEWRKFCQNYSTNLYSFFKSIHYSGLSMFLW